MQQLDVLQLSYPTLNRLTFSALRHLCVEMGEEFEIEPDLAP
jgi:hypothetical protein